jgi:DNA repair protein RecO (recombination protein O)
MNTRTTNAIIMRIREFGESDLLVTFFTPDKGQLKGVAKGARRSRKRFVNCLDNFCLADLEYGSRKKEDLYFLHSCKLIDAFPGLRSDFTTLSRASYMIELTEILFPYGVAERELFHLLRDSFYAMATGERIEAVPVIFEIRAMALGGYGLNLEKCCMCGRRYRGEGTATFKPERGGIACLKCQQISSVSPQLSADSVTIMKVIQDEPLTTLKELSIPDEILTELRPVLKLHREYHLGQRLKTASYLE